MNVLEMLTFKSAAAEKKTTSHDMKALLVGQIWSDLIVANEFS